MNQKALSIDDKNTEAHSSSSLVYMIMGQYEKAIEHGQKAIEVGPNSAESHILVAQTMYYAGNFDDSIALGEQAVRLSPNCAAWYWIILGRSYMLVGRYQDALVIFEKLLEQAQGKEYDLWRANHYLAVTYSLMGQTEKAQIHLAEAQKFNSEYSLKYVRRINFFKDPKHLDAILDALRKAGLTDQPLLPLPDKPSIAVLPFANMSGDPQQEYFSDGITEEIITALSKTPKLFVIARNSTFTFKGKSVWVPDVGRKLGVRYVLEGSVRRAGDKVRITAQLIDAKTNHHLWAERYDRELEDIFAVQDEIALKVLAAIHVKLDDKEEVKYYQGTDNLEAFLKVLQGRYELLKFTKAGNILGRELVQQAIELDPEYAAAYNSLAGGLMISVWFGLSKSPKQTLIQAIGMAKKAVAIDESFESAYGLLAFLYTMVRKHDLGVENGERAVSLNPNCADCYGFYGIALRYSGRPKEAIANVKKAMRLNPFPKAWYYHHLGGALSESGQYEEAIQVFREGTGRYPDDQFQRYMLAWSYIYAGREEDALAQAAEVLRINPKFSVEQWAKTYPHVDRAVTKRHMEAMRKAGLK
jgi:TolB-like protein/Tfp pilus assembly protein PilF